MWTPGSKGGGAGARTPGLQGRGAWDKDSHLSWAWEQAEGTGSWAPCCVYSTWSHCPFWMGGGASGHTLGRLGLSPVYRPRQLLALATVRRAQPAAQPGGAQKRSGRGECTLLLRDRNGHRKTPGPGMEGRHLLLGAEGAIHPEARQGAEWASGRKPLEQRAPFPPKRTKVVVQGLNDSTGVPEGKSPGILKCGESDLVQGKVRVFFLFF